MNEIWKPVYNYEGYYEVSSTGRVRSLTRLVNSRTNENVYRLLTGRVLVSTINSAGYLKVRLSKKGVKKTQLVHHLVGESFLNHIIRSQYITLDHKNEDKLNNNLDNLQVISKRDNILKNRAFKKLQRTKL
jgi:hypothetical protein